MAQPSLHPEIVRALGPEDATRLPSTAELAALDEPDVPYRAALHAALDGALHAVAAARRAGAGADHESALEVAWLGPPQPRVVAETRDRLAARPPAGLPPIAWRMLPFDPATQPLPQPPGRTADVLVVGFALSRAGGRAGRVLGYALRALRDAETSSRLVLLDRVAAPLEPFVREAQARLHPNTSYRPDDVLVLPMAQRLAWHAAWSPYTPADLAWLCGIYGVAVATATATAAAVPVPTPAAELPQPLGHGRRYVVAAAQPQLQLPTAP